VAFGPRLTANFGEWEFLRPFVPEDPPEEIRRAKLPLVARLCQWLRDLAGSAGLVNSYWRSGARQELVNPAVSDSQHEVGEASDLSFPLISVRELAKRVLAAVANGTAPSFGQCIFYPDSGAVHISMPGATRFQEVLIGIPYRDQAGKLGRRYVPLTARSPELADLPAVPRAAPVLLIAIGILILAALFFRRSRKERR
jgi:hypothetical protein